MYIAVIILIFVVWTAAGFAWFIRICTVLQRNNDLDKIGNFKGTVLIGLGGPVVWLIVLALALSAVFKKVTRKDTWLYKWFVS